MSSIPPEYDVEDPARDHLRSLVVETDAEAAVGTFKALTDPLRVSVLRLLDERDLCVCVLVEVLEVEYSNLSYHLKVMRNAGLVTHEREGNFAEYRLTERGREMATLVHSVIDADPQASG